MAVHLGHVDAFFPYISSTGDHHPESCVFSQFLNLTAFLAFACMYIRYQQVNALDISSTTRRANVISFWFLGIAACLGLSMVANFQSRSLCNVSHLVGTCLLFVLGTIYFLLQSAISYKIKDCVTMASSVTVVIRLVLALLSLSLSIMTIVSQKLSVWFRNRPNHKQPSYYAHLVSTFGEWLIVLTFVLYMLTFYNEFKEITFTLTISPKDPETLNPATDRKGIKYQTIDEN